MWKGTPVVAGRAGGIPMQVGDGAGGLLIQTSEECVSAVRELLLNPDKAHELGQAGRERVRQHFLLPRLLLDELRLLKKLSG
jgi:trehalose synthase